MDSARRSVVGVEIEHKRRSGLEAMVMGGAMLATALTMAACSPAGSQEPVQTTAVEQETTTTEQQEAITVESVEIDASLIKTPEVLVEAGIQLESEWLNAGATPENAQAAMDYGNMEEYAGKIAAEYDAIFIEAYLPSDWQNNPNLATVVGNIIRIHKTTLALYFLTSFPDVNPADQEPYWMKGNIVGIVSAKANGNTATIVDIESNIDNADKNRVGESLTGGTKLDINRQAQVTRVYSVVDGRVVLTDIESAILSE